MERGLTELSSRAPRTRHASHLERLLLVITNSILLRILTDIAD